MNLQDYRTEDFVEMKQIEEALVRALLPFKEKSDPLLAAIALTRVLRVVLRLGDEKARKKLLPVLEHFLRGHTGPTGSNILWTPGD